MQFSHDKHQYFFEKFLRNEMKEEELLLFQKKLAENEKFKKDFEYYREHRKKIVQEELAEYDEPELLVPKPQKWGWVYTVISLFCIVLIVDYFLSANYAPEKDSQVRKPLIDKINIFKGSPKVSEEDESGRTKIANNKSGGNQSDAPEDTSMENVQPADGLIEVSEGNRMAIQGDYFVADSLFRVLDVAQIRQKQNVLRVQTDSLLDDSSLNLLVVKSFFKNPLSLPRQLLVEYWESPIHFHGYLFNGKKLLLYEVPLSSPVYLTYDEAANNYHVFIENLEYQLYPDNNFHKLREE